MNTGFAKSTGNRIGAFLQASLVLLLFFIAAAGQASIAMAQSPGTFTATGNMTSPRWGHSATLLTDGRVLIAGGFTQPAGNKIVASAELYDPATMVFTPTGDMASPRWGHLATLLPNGKVLIAGGTGGGASAELYDPSTGSFTATGDMTSPRFSPSATLLPDGRVFIAGGHRNFNAPSAPNDAELYDPLTGSFTNIGYLLETNDDTFSTTLLADGRVLIAGILLELYNPGAGRFSPIFPTFGSLPGFPFGEFPDPGATLLMNGKVLFAGGNADDGDFAGAELYDPSTGTFSATGNMSARRGDVTPTLLPDGTVLIAGSYGDGGTLASAELYDPVTGTFSNTGKMTTDRYEHTATLLNDGRVLIAGGGQLAGTLQSGVWVVLSSAELYHPAGIQFTPTVRIVDNDTGSLTTLAVGDSFSFLVTGAPPVSLVFVSEPGWSGSVGYTDPSGTFRLSGTVAASVVGTWQQTWTIGGVVAQPGPLQFTITPKP